MLSWVKEGRGIIIRFCGPGGTAPQFLEQGVLDVKTRTVRSVDIPSAAEIFKGGLF